MYKNKNGLPPMVSRVTLAPRFIMDRREIWLRGLFLSASSLASRPWPISRRSMRRKV